MKLECEKDLWEKAKDWFVSAGEFCRENWKGIVLIIGSIVCIIILVVAAPATGSVALALIEAFIYGQLVGGILSAAFTAFKGGSLEEICRSYIEGAFCGALYSLLFVGMGITAAGSVRFGDLAIRTLVKNSFFAGLLSQALGDAGDKFIKGDDISYGQIAVNSIWAGMIDAAFTGIVYGASRAFRALWQRFRGVGGEVEGGSGTKGYSNFADGMSPEDVARYINNNEQAFFNEFSERASAAGLNDVQITEAYNAMRAGDYSKMASYFDTSSPLDGAVFWSGDVNSAGQYAQSINGTILEQTPGGQVFNDWRGLEGMYPSWSERSPIWEALSRQYANGATGRVTYVHPSNHIGSMWQNVESRIIQEKIDAGIVTEFLEIFTNGK